MGLPKKARLMPAACEALPVLGVQQGREVGREGGEGGRELSKSSARVEEDKCAAIVSPCKCDDGLKMRVILKMCTAS